MKKKYQVIYADPPWDYRGQKKFNNKKPHKSAIDHYPTMTLHEMISEFGVKLKEWADHNSLLYMWTSSPHLDQAIALGTAWGFTYKTIAFVWYKQNKVTGYYTMSSCEMCLVFKRGKLPEGKAMTAEQFVSEKVREHSRKPDEVRKRIELMYPCSNKLEMFARHTPKGWDVFGNQLDRFDDTCKETNQTKLYEN